MSDFEKFCAEKNIPFKDVASPFERWLLRLNIIKAPIGLLSYPVRSLWLGLVFFVLFTGGVELLFWVLFQMSANALIPLNEQIFMGLFMIGNGPFAAFWYFRRIRKFQGEFLAFYK